jgi:PhnB protein
MSQTPIKRRGIAPYICVRGAAEAIDFYIAAFDAEELYRLTEASGKVGHAELKIGDGVLMLSDEYPDFGALAPASFGGSPVALHLSVPDCDAAVTRAEAAGATVLRPAKDEFYGDRAAMVACPFGYRWHLAGAKEEVTPAEMQKRWTNMLEAGQAE